MIRMGWGLPLKNRWIPILVIQDPLTEFIFTLFRLFLQIFLSHLAKGLCLILSLGYFLLFPSLVLQDYSRILPLEKSFFVLTLLIKLVEVFLEVLLIGVDRVEFHVEVSEDILNLGEVIAQLHTEEVVGPLRDEVKVVDQDNHKHEGFKQVLIRLADCGLVRDEQDTSKDGKDL